MFYDSMLLIGVLAGAALIPSVIFNPSQKVHETGEVIHELNPALDGVGFQLYLFSVMVIFFVGFWRKNGQTLGMQAWKIKVVDSEGNNPSIRQCLIRVVVATLSLACAGLGYWWQWIDKEKLNWHDRASKTRVVQLPKN